MGITAPTPAKAEYHPNKGPVPASKSDLSVRTRFLFMVGAAVLPWMLGYAGYMIWVALTKQG